jgi:hypothetical protein
VDIWNPLLTFTDVEDDATPGLEPPLVFLDDTHHPRRDDPRGGQFAVDTFAPDVLPILGEVPGLRFAMVDGSTGHCVAQVLDEFQCALLEDTLRAWRELRGVPLETALGERVGA